jgi:hypothetical protein
MMEVLFRHKTANLDVPAQIQISDKFSTLLSCTSPTITIVTCGIDVSGDEALSRQDPHF